ncbi:hypothetical protein L9F63_016179 [Diploptera punctata]|uniref:Centriolar and ciliogenesis-associated protein HYLS1 C-terminal domain-containing protein n=1 Tax=Diploptera punctata TaxID=6984 RepID=A0AAD8A1S0_DIPPU|nr:hypothetical protein L9F63_016179 [Diploptera punctata]
MAITLDPKEVKAHLHRLGYSNITSEQLREFIKDLKKLIKYDQRISCPCRESTKNSGSSYIDTTPETFQTSNSISSHSGAGKNIPQRPKSSHSCNKNILKISANSGDLENGDYRHDRSRQVYDHACSKDVADANRICTKISKQKENQKTRSKENLQEASKPKSSFIKPWNLNCGLQPGTVKRCDPVLLYKYYQDIWKQQKVPGENSHSDLRWCIREQMLGTDPHPRPVSQASSIGMRLRRRV